MCIAQSADIFGTGLVAGALVMGSFAVQPAAAKLDASSHVVLRQHLIRRLSKLMPALMLLPVGACIAASIFCRTTVLWLLNAFGGALSLATIGITVAINAPLNRRFARWGPHEPPYDWDRSVRRWNAANSLRTATALAAFVCAILAGS
jgi:uncharacterized membrane protein